MKFCRLQTVCVPRSQECTPFRKIKVWLLLPELPSSRKQAVPPTVVCNKFFLFHIISILPFKIYLPQNISVGREVKLNFKYLILADGRILEYPHSGSGEKRSVINIGDNFLPMPPHTITTANVDVNILPTTTQVSAPRLLAASITLLDNLDPLVRGEQHQHARAHVPLQHQLLCNVQTIHRIGFHNHGMGWLVIIDS